ncbi:MAG: hypothetical protein JXQ26_00790 [Tissierellales bacterium]|nr:hypothetical protein [Tissierellales bacterium]MBN2826493.1 hypothetical protein [Tissierellales bacterium]
MKKFNQLINGLFILAIGFSSYTLYRVYFSTRGLAPGVCPVNQYKTEITISIILSISFLVLSFIDTMLKKR